MAEVIVDKATISDLREREEPFFSLSLDVFLPVTLPLDHSDLFEYSLLPVAPPLKKSPQTACQCLFARSLLQCPVNEWVRDLLSFQCYSCFTTPKQCSSLPGCL